MRLERNYWILEQGLETSLLGMIAAASKIGGKLSMSRGATQVSFGPF